VLTTIIGFVIIRNKNTTALQKMNLQNGQNVIFNLMEHSITVFSGLLLIIPGFITDIIGLLLLIPSCRSFLLKLFIAKSNIKPSQHTKKDNDVIEGECWHEENDDNKPNT
jgi:UPF0716 protein FxsA